VRPLNRWGWTLIELTVGLSLASVVGAASVGLVVTAQRHGARVAAAAAREAERRAALLMLQAELAGLDAAGDLVGAWEDSLIYRAHLGLYVSCRPAERLHDGAVRIALGGRPWGHASLDPERHGVLVLWNEDAADRWEPARVTGVEDLAIGCPRGGPSRVVTLEDLTAPDSVPAAVLLRTFEVRKLAAYADGRGQWWVGLQSRDPASAAPRGTIQPALGPIAPKGLSFGYVDGQGTPVRDPAGAARLRITVVVTSPGVGGLPDTLQFEIALWTGSAQSGALPLALVVLAVLGVLAGQMLVISLADQRVARTAREFFSATGAAQEGVVLRVTGWDTSLNRLEIGDSAGFRGATPAGMAWYEGWVVRLSSEHFLIRADGHSATGSARVRLGLLAALVPPRQAVQDTAVPPNRESQGLVRVLKSHPWIRVVE
jgi:type II secretory pathway pseudopilin PulG